MTTVRIILITTAILAAAGLFIKMSTGKSILNINREGTHFPVVSGFNLNRQEFVFPRDFEGKTNLVIIPFQQYQQSMVNTWVPFLEEMEASQPGFIYYELPTIYEMPGLSRTFINEGMRAGIPDQKARERTITLYLDKESFRSALDINTENDIHLLLVDQDGNILWRNTGEYDMDKAAELSAALKHHLNANIP